jgi:spectinomycin phosphotransferase/16S rRNA (guanine(1405)-N(7))-methyltransferase
VRTPPDGLPDDVLVAALRDRWDVVAAQLGYEPVGFGSHHWVVVDAAGTRWFLTVDDLDLRRRSATESTTTAFERLRAALAAAVELRRTGAAFVVAPVPSGGEPVVRAGDRFAIALYPYVDGESYPWDGSQPTEDRLAVLDLLIQVHGAERATTRDAMADDLAVPLADLLGARGHGHGDGPYSVRVEHLLRDHEAGIRALLERHGALAAKAREQPDRRVLTHGEPHPGNTMRTADGWALVDWDMAQLAQPERDLWMLDPGDGSILSTYAERTGVVPQDTLLELYRIRWDLADMAAYVHRLRGPHAGNEDDEKSWGGLHRMITALRP